VNYSAIRGDLTEEQFAKWLTTEVGVAAIPVSCFYGEPTENKTVRFCFAKRDETLSTALDRLSAL
jgi:methionine aminotransferase